MELIPLYKSILQYAGCQADEEGYVSLSIAGENTPALVKGARLVLPTREHLKTFQPGEKVIFHPLSENVLRGESEIIADLKQRINIRTNMILGALTISLLQLVADSDKHKLLDPEQSELLIALGAVEEKSVINLTSIVTAASKKNMTAVFTNIYLKKGGSVNGHRFARAGITTFPFWNELTEDKKDIFGVGIRLTKDKPIYTNLMKFIFPEIETPEAYNYGSASNTAPYLDALMKTSLKINARLAYLCELYKPFINGLTDEDLVFDSEWVEAFDNLDALQAEIRKVPMQAGNEGSAKVEQPNQAPVNQPLVAPAQMGIAPVASAAAPVAASAPAAHAGALPWQNVRSAQAPQPYQAAPYPGAQQFAHAPAAPARPVMGKGGLDFNSLKAAVPSLAMAPNALPGRQYPGMVQQQAAPRWAVTGVATPINPQYQQYQSFQPGYQQPFMAGGVRNV